MPCAAVIVGRSCTHNPYGERLVGVEEEQRRREEKLSQWLSRPRRSEHDGDDVGVGYCVGHVDISAAHSFRQFDHWFYPVTSKWNHCVGRLGINYAGGHVHLVGRLVDGPGPHLR